METICPICKIKFIKKRKEQKYCSINCFGLSQQNFKKCLICKRTFHVKRRAQVYCSNNCANKRNGIKRRFKNCVWCGAPVDRSKLLPGRPILCKHCSQKYRKEVHNPRSNLNRQPIEVRCSICRIEKKIKYTPRSLASKRDCYQCAECRASKKNISKILMENKKEQLALSKSVCTVCNIKLNDKNRTHKSSHQKCDACMYYQRRIYKTKVRLGVDKKTAEKLVAISVISTTGLVEIKTIKRKEKTCTNRTKTAERILISNP